jgi:hypothetical protein
VSIIEDAVARAPQLRAEAAQKAEAKEAALAAARAEEERLRIVERHRDAWNFQQRAASQFQKMTGKGTGPKRWQVVWDRGLPSEARIVLAGLEFRVWNGLSYLDVRWVAEGGRWFSLRSSSSGPVADRLTAFLASAPAPTGKEGNDG